MLGTDNNSPYLGAGIVPIIGTGSAPLSWAVRRERRAGGHYSAVAKVTTILG